MYFAADPDKREIQNDSGDTFSVDQFKTILTRNQEKGKFLDMTQLTQRLVRMDFDWDALDQFYAENG